MTGATEKSGSFTGFFFSSGKERAAAFPTLVSVGANGFETVAFATVGDETGSGCAVCALALSRHRPITIKLTTAAFMKTFTQLQFETVLVVSICPKGSRSLGRIWSKESSRAQVHLINDYGQEFFRRLF